MSRLLLADPLAYADLAAFVGRARRVLPDGAVRLRADGMLLAVYAEVVRGQALFADDTVVGVRGTELAEPATLDVTVASGALAERFAHDRTGPELAVPPAPVHAPWVGVLPRPGDRWELAGVLAAEDLEQTAASAEPQRARAPTDPLLPAGAAFAARALGFLVPGERVQVYRLGRWTRLRTARGYVLAR